MDIRGLLGTIQAPVLVLHRTGDRLASVNASRYMAERIPGARLVELPGDTTCRSSATRTPWPPWPRRS